MFHIYKLSMYWAVIVFFIWFERHQYFYVFWFLIGVGIGSLNLIFAMRASHNHYCWYTLDRTYTCMLAWTQESSNALGKPNVTWSSHLAMLVSLNSRHLISKCNISPVGYLKRTVWWHSKLTNLNKNVDNKVRHLFWHVVIEIKLMRLLRFYWRRLKWNHTYRKWYFKIKFPLGFFQYRILFFNIISYTPSVLRDFVPFHFHTN